MMKQLLICVLSAMLLWACDPQEKPKPQEKPRVFPAYNAALDEIIRSPDGVIRGVNLNSKADLIKKAETIAPLEAEQGHLYFEYQLDSLTTYSITYTLQNDSLEEINVQINCKDLDLSSKIFSDLKEYYEKKLPNPTEDKGYVVYNCFEGQRKPFVVSLSDNSTPTKGIISLVIYKDK
ncbi:MAG: hypothetical protein ACXVP0_00655 [Bacteroidia bacterium]